MQTLTRTIIPGVDEEHLQEAVEAFTVSGSTAALTGAGISVESGIPDFRSPGGLWTEFAPDEYATLDVFLRDPAKAWRLYRTLGRTLVGKRPNPTHAALARLEAAGRLDTVVTQNVDGLHQAAGSRSVIELHGDHHHLQCLQCGWLGPVEPEILEERKEVTEDIPRCPQCHFALKPNVVLFGEDVREMDTAAEALRRCDLLLVVGTSAQVYPAAGLPAVVKEHGGLIFEFNTEETDLTRGITGAGLFGLFATASAAPARTDFFFTGQASETLTLLADALLGRE